MHFECARCNYTTMLRSNFYKHTQRKKICKNINGVDENINLFESSKVKKAKVVFKDPDSDNYVCRFCNEKFNSRATAYRHTQKNHVISDKIDYIKPQKNNKPITITNTNTKQLPINDMFQNDFIHKKTDNASPHITQNNKYFTQNINNHIQQIFMLNNFNMILPFEQESLRHIEPYVVLDAIFNCQNKKSSENSLHTLDVFSRIHQELIKDSKNNNVYLKGFFSKHVTYLNDNMKFENNSIENAIFARVKRIYDETIKIYNNIRYNTPSLFIEIYEKYEQLIDFPFKKTDFDDMLIYLSTTLTQLFDLYKTKSFISNKQEFDLVQNIKSHWFDTKNITRNNFDKFATNLLTK